MNKTTSAIALALTATLCLSSAKADNYAYVEGEDGPFGTIDLTTGAYTSLGNTTLGATTEFLSGLGVANGALFGASYGGTGGTLYSVNPANGSLTVVGTSSVSYEDLGSTTSGLFEVGKDFNLYSISPTTGAATLVGPTGLSSFGGIVGISAGSSALYFTSGANLYSINTTTGLATLIGSTGYSYGAEVGVGGLLYGGNYPANSVDTLDTTTATPTIGPAVTGGLNAFWGLAPDPIPATGVPDETSTLGLLTAVGCVGFLVRRRFLARLA